MCKSYVVFQNIYFSQKNNIKGCTKETTFFFSFFGPTRINHRSYVTPFTMENQGYVVLYEKLFGKLFEK